MIINRAHPATLVVAKTSEEADKGEKRGGRGVTGRWIGEVNVILL